MLFSESKPLRISLTISAKLNHVEVNWYHAKPTVGTILIADEPPSGPYRKYETFAKPPSPIASGREAGATTEEPFSASTQPDYFDTTERPVVTSPVIPRTVWTYGPNNRTALEAVQPDEENGWITTKLPFNNTLSKSVNVHTRCYGYWAIYIDDEGFELASTCISAQPTWMNDMRHHIQNFRFCNLFIVGSHDSGSFRSDFNPHGHDSIVTKYSLTQVNIIAMLLLVYFCLFCVMNV